MQALPIVMRELRVASRRPNTYRGRLSTALLATAFGVWVYFVSSRIRGVGAGGSAVFLLMAQIGFIYCLFAGIGHTADCLSQEKREGTLGLLFLTDLKSYDIVLGKLFATSLNSIYGLLATFPILSLTLLSGGVQAGQFWRLVLSLLNTLFFSLACGMFVSSVSRRQLRAGHGAALVVIFFWIALPALSEVLAQGLAPNVGVMMKILSPAYAHVAGTGMAGGIRLFWWSLLATHLTGWLFLILASWILPFAWQDKVAGRQRFQWKRAWRNWTLERRESRRSFRTRLLDQNPFYWLAARERFKPVGTWLLLGGLALLGVWFWQRVRPAVDFCTVGAVIAVIAHVIVKLQVSTLACLRLSEERNQGTLEFLLSTPLTIPQILRGQWMALRRHFLGPVVAVLLFDGIIFLGLYETHLAGTERALEIWLPVFLSGMVMLVADVVALGWVGMWAALSAKQVKQASGMAAGRILILPWLFFLLAISILAALEGFLPGLSRTGPPFWQVVLLWFVVGVLSDWFFAARSRRKLLTRFRIQATEKYEPDRRRWFR